MNADDFATQLAAFAPAASALMATYGMSAADAERSRAGYFCRRISQSDQRDPLLDLCTNFDLSSFEVGMVRLKRRTDFDQDHWDIGRDESDTIIYPKSGGFVSLRDHGDLNREVCKCARTAEGFLSALLVVAEFSAKCALQDGDPDQVAARQALEQCLRLAGKESRPFYFTLLGVT
jgi:hypothetical protein